MPARPPVLAAFLLVVATVGPRDVAAQDITLQPSDATLTLTEGFAPDPQIMSVDIGGPVDATPLGPECVGFIPAAPHVRVLYTATAGDRPLVFSVESEADPTMVVRDPAGNWLCNDDSRGRLDPQIVIEAPVSGEYNVWLGAFNLDEAGEVALAITSVLTDVMDRNLATDHGEATLGSVFEPEPYLVEVTAGGDVRAERAGIGDCYGYVATQPDFRFHLDGVAALIVSAISSEDTTLIVMGPDGAALCDDDSGQGVNPWIFLDGPVAGQYDVWVATFSPSPAPAMLSISRTLIDATREPHYPALVVSTGFEPQTLNLRAGGPIDAARAIGEGAPDCGGYVSGIATTRVRFTAGVLPLIFAVESDQDTTLLVLDPAGNWVCDDDSGDVLNPAISFDNPVSGDYVVWVGTYFAEEARAALTVAEGAAP
jgi:hypothetical protein